MPAASPLIQYAFISHESAVEAIWALARRASLETLVDEDVYLIPSPDSCVCTQSSAAELIHVANIAGLGIAKRPIHMLAPTASARSRGEVAIFHVWSDTFPSRSFIRAHKRVFVSSPLFAVLQLAMLKRPSRLDKRRERESAKEELAIREELGLPADDVSAQTLLGWEGIRQTVVAAQTLTDFAGTYRLPCAASGETLFGMKPLATRAQLGAFARESLGRGFVRGISGVQRAIALAFNMSASPMETTLALLLTLPVDMGGYGLPRPELNRRISFNPEERAVTRSDELFTDLCWPGARLIIEYDSSSFHPSADRAKARRDRSRANSLTALGWKVLSVNYGNIASVQESSLLARQAACILGVGLEEPTQLGRIFRSRLHAMLLPKLAEP